MHINILLRRGWRIRRLQISLNIVIHTIMVEPFSLCEAITLLTSVIVTIRRLIKEYDSYPEVVERLMVDLSCLEKILSGLLPIVKNDTSQKYAALEMPVKECQNLCHGFETLLAETTKNGKTRVGRMRGFVDWKIKSSDVQSFSEAIATMKSTLSVAVGAANL